MLSIRCMCKGIKLTNLSMLQSRNISRFRSTNDFFFKKNLLMTNILSCGVCMIVGDLLQQENEYQQKMLQKRYDWDRLARMSVVGMGMGPLHHYYYIYLDKVLPGVTMKIVMKKIVLDQIIASPLFLLYFFYAMGLLEQKTLEEITAEIKNKFFYVYTGDWLFWPPVQLINFYFLPARYRVVYINVATMVYNIFISFVKHYDKPTEKLNGPGIQ